MADISCSCLTLISQAMEVRIESKVVPKIIEFMEETKGKYELKT